jgi:thymidine kinase
MSKLTFVFSSMKSGKTLAPLTKNFMLCEKGFKTLLVKPALDDRTPTISSRIGLEKQYTILSKDYSFLD